MKKNLYDIIKDTKYLDGTTSLREEFIKGILDLRGYEFEEMLGRLEELLAYGGCILNEFFNEHSDNSLLECSNQELLEVEFRNWLNKKFGDLLFNN